MFYFHLHPMVWFSFLLVAIEATYSAIRRDGVYTLNDTLANIIITLGYHFVKLLLFTTFVGTVLNGAASLSPFNPVPLRGEWLAVCIILIDCIYYWEHRLSHEINAMWAFHSVHHSSQKFNLGIAVRLSWFEEGYRWIFLVPLSLLGFPVPMIISAKFIQRFYMFLIHTPYVGKLGWCEWIFLTPSQHRVHHGRNAEYIDKNYGGMLCVWDRLWGSFEPERAPSDYGLVKQIDAYNPFLIQWMGFRRLFQSLNKQMTFGQKMKYLFGKPHSA